MYAGVMKVCDEMGKLTLKGDCLRVHPAKGGEIGEGHCTIELLGHKETRCNATSELKKVSD